MSIKYIYFGESLNDYVFDDIACDDADVIINAANGCGWWAVGRLKYRFARALPNI